MYLVLYWSIHFFQIFSFFLSELKSSTKIVTMMSARCLVMMASRYVFQLLLSRTFWLCAILGLVNKWCHRCLRLSISMIVRGRDISMKEGFSRIHPQSRDVIYRRLLYYSAVVPKLFWCADHLQKFSAPRSTKYLTVYG